MSELLKLGHNQNTISNGLNFLTHDAKDLYHGSPEALQNLVQFYRSITLPKNLSIDEIRTITEDALNERDRIRRENRAKDATKEFETVSVKTSENLSFRRSLENARTEASATASLNRA